MTNTDVAGPDLRIESYFNGYTRAQGLVQDRFGRIRRRFTVEIEGVSVDGAFELRESFVFDGGERSRRTWRIVKTGEDSYEGRARDVVGVATGRARGDTLRWAYRLRLPIGGREFVVGFDDRMILGQDGILLNVALMHKWGITLGHVVIAFTRPDDTVS